MGPSSLPGLGPISLEVHGRGCNHHRVFDVDCYPDDVPVPSFGPRMVCTAISFKGVNIVDERNVPTPHIRVGIPGRKEHIRNSHRLPRIPLSRSVDLCP